MKGSFAWNNFLASSPKLRQSGQFHFLHHRPLRFLSVYRFSGMKSAANRSSDEQIKLDLGNIKGLDDALSLSKMRPSPSAIQFTQLLSRVVDVKEYSAAIFIFRVMCSLGSVKPDINTYRMVINSLCKNRLMDYALKLFDEISEKGITPNVITYSALICGLCNLSRWREVKIILKEMIDCKLLPPNVVTFTTIIDSFCKESLVDEAEDILHIMMQRNVIPDAVYPTAYL